MLLLEAILVVLMLTIGHLQCSSIPHAFPSTDNEAFSILPSGLILSTRDSEGCTKQVFPKDLTGFLSLSCMKNCKDGTKRPETNGEECIVTVTQEPTNANEAVITVGTCRHGTCVAKEPVECITITLTSSEEEDE
uniref:Putative serine/threonine-protein kinase n=1 Tax=Ixodes ricinus TaxID=34613 RepID=A0A6B0USK3_IXORI